jgi:hypothetical protein
MMLCKDNGKEIEVVGFSCAESVRKLFCFGVLLGGFLLSLASNVHY